MLIPELEMEGSSRVSTVSHTFKRYNGLATIYLIIPLTIFFTFRNYRVFINKKLRDEEKKTIFIALIISQISLFVVTRYDQIQGTWHYIFTFLTISLLLLYHSVVRDTYQAIFYNIYVKTLLIIMSIVSICTFASLFIIYPDIEDRPELYTVACVAEVLGLLCLGLLDVIDIYILGWEIDQVKNKE